MTHMHIPDGILPATYVISGAQLADAGDYRIIATSPFGTSTSAVATVTVTGLADVYQLAPIWSNAVGTQPYLTLSSDANVPHFRSLAYNALSNQLYLVSRVGGTDAGVMVSVLDPATGVKQYELLTNDIVSLVAAGTGSLNLVS